MPISFNNVEKVYHGTTPIKKVYRGSAVEWDGHDYMYIENTYNGSNTLTLTTDIYGSTSTSYYSDTVQYSKDKLTWTTATLSTSSPLTITMNVGEKVYFRNDNGKWNYYSGSDSVFVRNYFRCSQSHVAGGNINSLIDYTNMDNLALSIWGCLFQVFFRDSTLTSAADLRLPSTTLCNYCYTSLFFEASALEDAPALPATTLAPYCYYFTFCNCTSLITAPVLPATTLANNSYQQMFWHASSLKSVTIYANDISATDCLLNWLSSVAPNGIIHQLGTAALPVDSTSGQPVGWIACDTYPAYVKIRNSYSGNNTITITKNGSPADITLDYSTDKGNTWSTWSSANGNFSLTLSNGQSVYFKGDNSTFCSYDNYYTFNGTQSHTLGGNLVMLFDSTGTADSLPDGVFYKLFSGNTKLTYARNAIITATNFGDSSCHSMFLNCTAIGTAPNFTVNTIKTRGCSSMFDGATNLTYVNGIHLNATTLPNGAYKIMFRGTKIVDAPEIMATSIYAVSGDNSNGSLSYMFINCASLNTIKVHFTNWNSGNGTYYWTQGCKNTGTFYKPSALPSTKNASGNSSNPHYIPYNWTVTNI